MRRDTNQRSLVEALDNKILGIRLATTRISG